MQFEIFWKVLKQTYHGKEDYIPEAKYYLELHNYDMDAALTEFEADIAFEWENKKELQKQLKQSSKRQLKAGQKKTKLD